MIVIFVLLTSAFGQELENLTPMEAFDCGQPESFKTYSLRSSGKCNHVSLTMPSRPARYQILRKNTVDVIEGVKCSARRSVQAIYCGGWEDATAWGLPHHLEVDKPVPISNLECQQMHVDKKMSIGGQVVNIAGDAEEDNDDKNRFGFDYMESGGRTTDGWCSAGDAFIFQDKTFNRHAKLAAVFGSTERVKLSVDKSTNTVTIENTVFDAALGTATVDGTRYTWTPRQFKLEEQNTCSDTVTSVYTGPVTLFTMDNNKTMLTAGNKTSGQYFGVPLTGEEIGICGRNAKVTKINDIVAVELRPGDEPLPNLKSLDKLSGMTTYEQLIAVIGYEYVQLSQTESRAQEKIISKFCEQDEAILKNRLSILRNSHDGMVSPLLDEPGLFGIQRGAVIHMLKCAKVKVNYRHMDQVTNDIPAFCDGRGGPGMRVPCFVDPISMTIKNTTRYYAPGGHTEVMWEINHNWYCKKGARVSRRCKKVEVLKPSEITLTEDMEIGNAFQTGGFYGTHDGEDFSTTVTGQQGIYDHLQTFAKAAQDKWAYIQYLPGAMQDGFLKTFIETNFWGFVRRHTEYLVLVFFMVLCLWFVDKVTSFFRLCSTDGPCDALLIVLLPTNAEASRRKDAANERKNSQQEQHQGPLLNIYMPDSGVKMMESRK